MTTKEKRRADQALIDARCLAARFRPYAEEWRLAGSLRRGKTLVGDVDHVVVPHTTEVATGLFSQDGERLNQLWKEIDAAIGTKVAGYELIRGPRWGDKQRTLIYNGFQHELWTAEPKTIGIQMVIRTGPAEFSRAMVTRLKRVGYPARDGRVWDGPGPHARPIPTANETEVFKLAGMRYIKPEDRG